MSTPTLRSHNWFGKKDLDGFSHRSWIKAEGFSELMFDGRQRIDVALVRLRAACEHLDQRLPVRSRDQRAREVILFDRFERVVGIDPEARRQLSYC